MISYEKITGYNNKKDGDFSMTVMNLSDFFILNIKNNDYRVYISNIDKKEAIIIFKKSNLNDKGLL